MRRSSSSACVCVSASCVCVLRLAECVRAMNNSILSHTHTHTHTHTPFFGRAHACWQRARVQVKPRWQLFEDHTIAQFRQIANGNPTATDDPLVKALRGARVYGPWTSDVPAGLLASIGLPGNEHQGSTNASSTRRQTSVGGQSAAATGSTCAPTTGSSPCR